ncbi:uncharacterized protein LOC124183343 isoform X2 [Neodiprion fabricii]|uniref:uncharacterized protein LOC124183343 isoform X2 n=1 Tax=Neodiprion fabricii TaxID=2872261 RepID=UPI001ED93E3D|nr:uncharacterized protein LOC124183343 isoform X2 [Neodiprion fabricii]
MDLQRKQQQREEHREQRRDLSVVFAIAVSLTIIASGVGATDGEDKLAAVSSLRISDSAGIVYSNKTLPEVKPIEESRERKEMEVEEGIGDDEDEDETLGGDEAEEYDGEEEDEVNEYTEELKALAESHEAMSRRDDQHPGTKNRSGNGQSSPSGSPDLPLRLDTAKKDFDSREKSVESGSDESETSNEAILDGTESEDKEVTELLKYKGTNHFRVGGKNEGKEDKDESVKMKRVPTVKKELSTQKEIKTRNDSSAVEKRFGTKETLEGLNDEAKQNSMGQAKESRDDKTASILTCESSGVSDVDEEEFMEPELEDYMDENLDADKPTDFKVGNFDPAKLEDPRKLDKRQEAVLRDLEAYLRAEYDAEQEQQQKLQELGAQEGALAESLLELLVKLAENPRRWKRVHRLLMDVEGGLELSRQALEARKRAFNLNSSAATTVTPTTTSPVSTTPKKPRKKPKLKKKKKKQRHHRFSTTTTSLPTTIPLLTTTEAPWLITTPMKWRLVAERLFGPPWAQDLQDDPEVAKVRLTAPSGPRKVSLVGGGRDFVDQLGVRKQLDEHKALNTERQALMLESSREYTEPRRVHYGKVSTHQGGISSSREPSAEGVAGFRTGNRDPARVRGYDPPQDRRLGLGSYAAQLYSRGHMTSAGDEFGPVQSYAQNREYRPPGREYAASASWRDSRYKYGRPSWKAEDPEQWRNYKFEPREYWSSRNTAWERRPAPWEPPKNPAPWEEAVSASQTKGNDESAGTPDPKITVKTWNSLTSDPATWPFKLADTKPWPKDANGKSYNPNAALVRKLGLDQDAKTQLETHNVGSDLLQLQKSNGPSGMKYKGKGKELKKEAATTGVEAVEGWSPKAAMSPKIQSVGAWVMPADQSTWKPYNLKTVDSYGEPNRQRWNPEFPGKFSKQGDAGSWPKWKQFAYHRVTATPILSQGAPLDGPRARNNAYIAVSAVTSPKYNGNQWRKNDIEETPVAQNAAPPLLDSDHPVSQLRAAGGPPIYTWKKDGVTSKVGVDTGKVNATDPLEEQLETLRRDTAWSHDENRDKIKKQLNVINDASETLASRFASGGTSNSSNELETSAIPAEDGGKGHNSPNLDADTDQNTKDVSHK